MKNVCILLLLMFSADLTAQTAAAQLTALNVFPTETAVDRTRPRLTDGDLAPEDKSYLNSTVFPVAPRSGEHCWIEYALPADGLITVELLDPRGYSYLLLNGARTAGLVVDALRIPAHLSPGTYFLKIKAGNGRAVIPLIIR